MGVQSLSIESRWRWPPAKARPLLTVALLYLLCLPYHCGIARPYLVFANKKDIRLVEVSPGLPTPKATIVVKALEDAAALDFFLKLNKVCWTELSVSLPVIRCSEINPVQKGKLEKITIVESGLRRPEGLACDWVNNKIYWTDSETKRIEVTSLDPDPIARKVLFWDNIELPRAIVVAPNDGIMFWSDWGDIPKIERASMDGDPSSRRIIVDQDIAWPNGITLDYEKKLLYWVEAKHRYIASVDWEGNNRKIIFDEREALPQAFAISTYYSELYWTDWTTNSLNMYNFSSPSTAFTEYADGSSYHVPERIKFKGKLTPMDIKVFEPMRQKAGISACSVNNGGCSHLCLASPSGHTCSCPTGIKLLDVHTCADSSNQLLLLAKRYDIIQISLDTPDYTETVIPFDINLDMEDKDFKEFSSVAIDYDPVDGFVYWSDQNHGIFRSMLNGSEAENIISQEINHPDGLAVDWLGRNIFWIDNGNDRIEVAKLDGSSRRILISRDLDEPRDIALDPLNGWMYWSDWGEAAQIERAWMDGTHRSIIASEEVGWPNGIALDVDLQHLYFCDAKRDRIEMMNTDGTGRRVVIEGSLRHPFGLSVLGDFIYWTDWDHNSVERANKLTGEDNRLLMVNHENLMSVETVNTKPNASWTNACAKKNGGCSHLCLVTPVGRVCECSNGYEIVQPDGVECVVPEAFLLYTRKSEIGRVSITTPNHNGYILPIKGISESSALDFDITDGRIYWTDNEDKTINRAYLNGSHKEVIVAFGLDYPDGMAVDWVSGNIYWTDTGLNRIEVARCDGTSRRVLIWKDLINPASIAIDPAAGSIYWSTWSDVSVIERAAMDGSGREVFVSDVKKTNGLTIDFELKRLYWTDIDKQSISYAALTSSGKSILSKAIVQVEAAQLYGLSLYKSNVYWTDLKRRTIERANKENGTDRFVVQSDIDDVIDILIYHKSRQIGDNPCSINNGGCNDLCLYVNKTITCACPSHLLPSGNSLSKECVKPDQFLLFSQKNKMSRLLMDDKHPGEVPDLVLPVYGARDIQSIGYDPTDRLIYWIDYGSKKKAKHYISIRRAYDNGTLLDRIFHGSNFRPYDLAVDPYARLLYWSCEQTNAINVTRIDIEDPEEAIVGSILGGSEDRPRSIALHSQMSYIFWVNIAAPIRIERSKVDGHDRKVIVNSSLGEPSDLSLDIVDDLLFWADISLKRIESSGLNGENRRIVIENGIQGQVLIAIQGRYIYWADRGQQSILRANKMTGKEVEIVKAKAPHMSALLSVLPKTTLDNPCLRADCSHLCLVDRKKGLARCSCPSGSGLVLNADDRTCGLPPTCKPAEFTCTTGSPACIPLQWRCDGQAECSDHSDEIGCPECGAKQFKCRNNDCLNGTLICDGIKHCEDSSDELNCCAKDKFQCTISGECIDNDKTCNGVNDCSDKSDELLPQCNSIPAKIDSPNGDSVGVGIPIAIGFIVVLCMGLVGVVGYFILRRNNSTADNESNNPLSPSLDIPPNGTLQRVPAPVPEKKIMRTAPNGMTMVNNNSTLDDADIVSGGGVMSTVSGPSGAIGGSSNGIAYDRSHVTGASSSTTSSSNFPRDFSNPPPSPATVVANSVAQRQQPPRQHQSMHSLPRSRHHRGGRMAANRQYNGRSSHHIHHPPPPPTPYSTDFNEESDYGIGPSGPNYPSAANSTHGGYESSDAYAEHLGFNNPPPLTPHYYSDYVNENSCPPSPTPEENTFFLTQPPPSPVPSVSPLDDDEENDCR